MIDWRIEADAFGSCNCDQNCPCQFELLPTHGHCRGFEVGRITRGHFGAARLDGLHYAVFYAWPGPVFEGNGEMQAIIDERADAAQRKALHILLHGGEVEEAKTHWWVFHAMSSTVHEPIYSRIELDMDIEGRTARVVIPGMLESVGRPIISPATGDEHRVRIDIPDGIEFEIAEVGTATTRATGAITLELDGTYGQWNRLRHHRWGVIRGVDPAIPDGRTGQPLSS